VSSEPGLSTDDAIRALLALMPRLVGRAKRLPPPDELRSFDLAPRHLSLLSYLLFDGPMTVNDLAERLEVAPTTVSLMVGDLSRAGILERREDDADRRRRIVSIAGEHQPAIRAWLARGATAWREALGSLTPAQRRTFVSTLLAYERALDSELSGLNRRDLSGSGPVPPSRFAAFRGLLRSTARPWREKAPGLSRTMQSVETLCCFSFFHRSFFRTIRGTPEIRRGRGHHMRD
jgi:DNA-binding MarR family transcriptional regulator